MLSSEEKAGMLIEADDPHRREELRQARRRSMRRLLVGDLLTFLSRSSDLLLPWASLPRRHPRPGCRYLL
jgi:hypothetical protein